MATIVLQHPKNLKPVQSCATCCVKNHLSADAMLHVSIFCATILSLKIVPCKSGKACPRVMTESDQLARFNLSVTKLKCGLNTSALVRSKVIKCLLKITPRNSILLPRKFLVEYTWIQSLSNTVDFQVLYVVYLK